MGPEPTTVAIACQGGGSHTAFTAGALQRLMPEIAREGYDIVGFSGTSGGAVCALLAWYGYTSPDHAPSALLGEFWNDLKAVTPAERGFNDAAVGLARLRTMGVPFAQFSPAQTAVGSAAQRRLRTLLERYVDFDHARSLASRAVRRREREDVVLPVLLVSAIDVLSGEFRVFRGREMSADAVLASAAEPGLFEAISVGEGRYWDGLFSKNPPVWDFSTAGDIVDPDEVWVIQINPSSRSRVPTSLEGIADRRNELSGNTSLEQEVAFIEQVNEWVDAGYLPDQFSHTDVRRVRFDEELPWSTKLDRSPAFIEGLFRTGRAAADSFLDERRAIST
jgi:NTE family protein